MSKTTGRTRASGRHRQKRPKEGASKPHPRRGRWLLVVLAAGAVAALLVGGAYARQNLRQTAAFESLSAEPGGDAGPAGPPAPSPTPPADPEAEAQRICELRLDQYRGESDPLGVTLLASYPSRQGDVAAAEQGRDRPYRNDHADRPPDEFVAVCFFEADFFDHSPRPDQEPERERRQEVVRPDGTPSLFAEGRAGALAPAPMPRRADR